MKILVIEGAPLILRTIVNALAVNHDVVDLDRGRRALERLDEIAPDAIIIGSEVVGMRGVELAMHVRAHRAHRKTPLLLVSGKRSYEDVLQAVHCGVDEYVAAPFTGEVLLRKLNQAVNRKLTPPPASAYPLPIGDLFVKP